MNELKIVVALITRENDYQAEQAASAVAAAARLEVRLQVIYADNDAVNQTQQLVKIIQDSVSRPAAILVEPVGTSMVQVARAAVAAGISWGVLNREAEYISELRRDHRAASLFVTTDQEEVGKIQGKQVAALVKEGNILYVEGPSSSSVALHRTKGMLATKPTHVMVKSLKGDWTEQSAHHAVRSWLSLSTSRQLHIRAVVCHNDAMAMGARKALIDLTEKDREEWQHVPFLGCDGVSRTGQEWVRRGLLSATVITPVTAGPALEALVKAIRSGIEPPERIDMLPESFPPISQLVLKHGSSVTQAKGLVAGFQNR
jgi:ABC-type sugar transport system substrate-binding protein